MLHTSPYTTNVFRNVHLSIYDRSESSHLIAGGTMWDTGTSKALRSDGRAVDAEEVQTYRPICHEGCWGRPRGRGKTTPKNHQTLAWLDG